jgi:hypothetical protein
MKQIPSSNGVGRKQQNVIFAPTKPSTSSTALRQRSLLIDNRWKKWPELGVQIGPGLKTDHIQDLYVALKSFGELERIEIFKNDQNDNEGRARVYLRKVKSDFWTSGHIRLAYGDGQDYHRVPIKLLEPTKTWTIRSPLNPNKQFREKYVSPGVRFCLSKKFD